MAAEVTTAEFVRTHGKAPRGFGSWAFQASTTRAAFDADRTGEVTFVTATFTEARKRAVAHLAADARFVAVLG